MPLTPASKLVLQRLKELIKLGRGSPAGIPVRAREIAQACKISTRSVRRALALLVRAHILNAPLERTGGRGVAVLYSFREVTEHTSTNTSPPRTLRELEQPDIPAKPETLVDLMREAEKKRQLQILTLQPPTIDLATAVDIAVTHELKEALEHDGESHEERAGRLEKLREHIADWNRRHHPRRLAEPTTPLAHNGPQGAYESEITTHGGKTHRLTKGDIVADSAHAMLYVIEAVDEERGTVIVHVFNHESEELELTLLDILQTMAVLSHTDYIGKH